MSGVTHEQASLMLQLFDLRRETKLREARDWFSANFFAASPEEMMQKFPFGTKENAYFRMVASYWDMSAGIVNRGLIDDDLYFESNGEAWGVWDRVKGVVPGMRAMFGNPQFLRPLEELAGRMEAWREKNAPGSTAKMHQMMQQMAQARSQSAKG
jgi:hypothetical protein